MPGVDELVGGRCDRGKDAQPGKRVLAPPDANQVVWNRLSAHAVKSVAPGDDIALQLVLVAVHDVVDDRGVSLEVRDCHILAFEPQRCRGRDTRRDQVLDHFGLAVDRDPASVRQRAHRDVAALTFEP
jgi:hypothetical protein